MQHFAAVTPQQFANKSWKRNASYDFVAQANILPIMVMDLGKATSAMPLGFVQLENAFQLVAITSWQPGTNLFVAHDGRWLGEYLPAILCGYPFRPIKPEDRAESILCIDEGSGLVLGYGMGEAFFDETGAPGQALQDMLDFWSQIELNRTVTHAAVEALQAAGLIEPWHLSMQQGEQMVPVNDLYRINEAALNALDAETLQSLRDKNALAIAYAQLFSMNQISMLVKLKTLREQLQTQAASVGQGVAGLEGFKLSQDDGTLKF